MRQLARFESEDTAKTLADYLYASGIDNRVDPSREGGFILWVHDEAQLDAAKEALALYEENPNDGRFSRARRQAELKKKKVQKEATKDKVRTVNMRKRWEVQRGLGPLTLVLIVACIGVAFLTTNFDNGLDIGGKREIVRYLTYATRGGLSDVLYGPFYEIRQGEVWRVITPIFLHFGILHIVFNLWWLRDLGTAIERKQSTLFFAVMVLVLAVLSNTGQYLVGSWNFGGMSGVVYGLFGYVWIRGKFDPSSGYGMNRMNVIIMIGFYFLCFTGLVGNIANTAHTVGLVVGALWGFAAAKLRR